LAEIDAAMTAAVQAVGGVLCGIFYCPHRPEEDCDCRKPKPGLLTRVERELGLSVQRAPFIGDKLSDIEAARAANACPVLVRTGYGKATERLPAARGVPTFDDQEPDPDQRRFLPHVIEPSAGADRGTLAFLCDAFNEDEVGGEARTVLKLHPRLAPIKAAVFPLVKKDGMPERALAIFRDLKRRFAVYYDEKGAIGRRYRRQDEAGTPYCITVDGETLAAGTVTLRERDSCEQTRVEASQLGRLLDERLQA
jgi:glycyl-tRNA synthetase (class II)